MNTLRTTIAASFLALTMLGTSWAADPVTDPAGPADPKAAAAATPPELTELKSLLEQQQKQIEQLRIALDAQKKLLDQAGLVDSTPAVAPVVKQPTPVVASTRPMLPPPAYVPPVKAPIAMPQTADGDKPAPTSIRIGDAYITPVGFMDMTAVFRSAAAGSGIGTNFGSIPYNNTPTARLTETRLNPQNSRVGARFDTKVHGAKVLGYWESDFLGTSGSNNLSVTNNAWVMRLRLFWVDVKKDKFEFLAGQSWSMMTPGRNGISPIPGDLFYSQDIDVNYNVGLTWARTPGFRFLYHPSDTVTAGLALENAEQYVGGSGGGGTITFPSNSNIATNYASQLDASANSTATPNLHPDIIGKIAFDPKAGGLHQHIEVAGLYRTFRVFNPAANNNQGEKFTSAGYGGAVNMNFELVKNFHVILNTYASNGGGRYLFGTGPDLVIRGDGSISPVHAYGLLGGVEVNAGPNTLLYGYYGDSYFGKNVVIDGAGKLAGYGFTGSGNGQNRNIQEPTIGLNQTLWKNANWGALNFMLQYAYINRAPWYVAPNAPKNAHNSTVFLNLRYTLPGAAPSIK